MNEPIVQILRDEDHSIVIVRGPNGRGSVTMLKRDVQRDDKVVQRLVNKVMKQRSRT